MYLEKKELKFKEIFKENYCNNEVYNFRIKRRFSYAVNIEWNEKIVTIGGNSNICVQSMTNTDTSDIEKTIYQIKELVNSGSEIVRISVNTSEAAYSVPLIRKKLDEDKVKVLLVGDFHYNGHLLLTKYPNCAKSLSKYRINPGNVGQGKKRDIQFSQMIEIALKYNKPIRIGVNWGSIDKDLLTHFMNENKNRSIPWNTKNIMYETLIQSAILSSKRAIELGFPKNKIILSCKVSNVKDLISIYRNLGNRCKFALHLGLTEAGIGSKGIISSTAAISILLKEGIGDTIRISLTPKPHESRIEEVLIGQQILQTMDIQSFMPNIISCPGCGRTTSSFFQELAMKIQNYIKNKMILWRHSHKGIEKMNVAVMGCIVNGPGESKHANIGISLPGSGENPAAPIYIDGKKFKTLRGKNIAEQFIEIINDYVDKNYKNSVSE